MFRAALAVFMLLLSVQARADLYDGTSLPSAQGWFSYVFGSSQALGSGYVNLDTSAAFARQAGYGLILPDLDSAVGFRIDFTVKIAAEAHGSNTNRAGFSVIVTDNNKNGIEMGFWEDKIWVQNLGFMHGAEIEFDTTEVTHYSLTLVNGIFTLVADPDGLAKTLTGSTVFYDANGLPAPFQNFPYRTPNVLFFGDDTTSASTSFNLYRVGIAAVPEASSLTFLLGGLLGVAGLAFARRRVRT